MPVTTAHPVVLVSVSHRIELSCCSGELNDAYDAMKHHWPILALCVWASKPEVSITSASTQAGRFVCPTGISTGLDLPGGRAVIEGVQKNLKLTDRQIRPQLGDVKLRQMVGDHHWPFRADKFIVFIMAISWFWQSRAKKLWLRSVQTLYDWGNTSSSSIWYETDWIERFGASWQRWWWYLSSEF